MKNSLLKKGKTGGGNEVDDEGKEEGSGNSGSTVSENGQETKKQDA
jgi:hypothetical protein